MKYKIEFSQEKNLLLSETRGVNFEDVIKAITKKKILGNLSHHDQQKYKNQKILVIKINKYVYAVPYVIDKKRKKIFLKTVYPSRVLNKKYSHQKI